jgi:hypothetical protein
MVLRDLLMKALEVKWECHAPWQPPSSGRVERMNQTLENQPTKSVSETRLPCTKCLPIALLRIRTAPQKDIGLSPYEMPYGLPFLSSVADVPSFETRLFPQKLYTWIVLTVLYLRKKGLLTQAPPLDFPIDPHRPGDYVITKTWKENKLEPAWEGPFLVLLTTETAV